jgi:hypothetical protein
MPPGTGRGCPASQSGKTRQAQGVRPAPGQSWTVRKPKDALAWPGRSSRHYNRKVCRAARMPIQVAASLWERVTQDFNDAPPTY